MAIADHPGSLDYRVLGRALLRDDVPYRVCLGHWEDVTACDDVPLSAGGLQDGGQVILRVSLDIVLEVNSVTYPCLHQFTIVMTVCLSNLNGEMVHDLHEADVDGLSVVNQKSRIRRWGGPTRTSVFSSFSIGASMSVGSVLAHGGRSFLALACEKGLL